MDGLIPAEVFETESHYLQKKWPLNSQQNCHVRTHPPLDLDSRLAAPYRLRMYPRIDDYDRNSRHAQGLARLAVQQTHFTDSPFLQHSAVNMQECSSIEKDHALQHVGDAGEPEYGSNDELGSSDEFDSGDDFDSSSQHNSNEGSDADNIAIDDDNSDASI